MESAIAKAVFASVFALLCLIPVLHSSDEFEGQMSLTVQHAFDSSLDAPFVNRGVIFLKSIRNGLATFNEDSGLSADARENLRTLANENGIYRLRVLIKSDDPTQFVSTYIKACSLYESRLSDTIILHLDQSGEVLGVSLTTDNMLCNGATVYDSQLMHFNTSVEIRQMENGPVPDTASYIQKLEKEKAEKAKGDQTENKSFFAKYWMYIVPVFIFLIISSAANPEAQAGGGR
uniref:ER membrane protein complex subunit 10 n=1 Tax=Strigamia maritima TaxID=126957 RepID=T1IXV2_STRMM